MIAPNAVGSAPYVNKAGANQQLSSTDNKIKNLAKTAFQKIAAFFASIKTFCKTKYAALKARITSYFKKSAPTASEKFQQTAERLSRFSGQDRKEDQKHEAAQQTERFSNPVILTPETGALVPYTGSQTGSPKAAGNSKDQDTMNSMIARSLRMLIDNNFELPATQLEELHTAASQLQGALKRTLNSKIKLTPDTRRDPVNVLGDAIVFAQNSFRANTSPNANVGTFSQLSTEQKNEIISQFVARSSTQTQPEKSPSSNLPLALFGASTAVIAGAAVLKNNPEAAAATAKALVGIAQNGASHVAEVAKNGAQMVADAFKSAFANAGNNNGRLEIQLM